MAREIGWAKLWDSCLDLGGAYVSGLQRVSMASAHDGRGAHPCPCCDITDLEKGEVLDHIVCHQGEEFHLEPGCSGRELLDRLKSLNLSKFRRLYNFY